MARENKYFSLMNASEVAQIHRPEVPIPGVRRAKNFYSSRSDNNLTLRGDMFRYRDDVYTIHPYWQVDTELVNDDDYLNMVITTGDIASDIFINRLSPMRAGSATPICSTYTTGTVTIAADESVVTGTGTYWLKNVWPHCFIGFTGEAEDPTYLYRIARVDSDTTIVIEGTRADHTVTGGTYTIYRVHDSDRALYPMHFEMFGQQYLYGASEPNEPDATDQLSTSGPFYLKRQDAASPAILNGPTVAFRKDFCRARYINSKFWIVGRQCILESSNGSAWFDRTPAWMSHDGFILQDIAWSGTAYMSVGLEILGSVLPVIATSTDGINWVRLSSSGYISPANEGNYSVAYGASTFVVTSAHGVYTTTDGVTLTSRTTPLGIYIQEVVFANSVFVGFAAGSGIVTSADGIAWTARTGAISKMLFGTSIWDGTNFVTAGMVSNLVRTEKATAGVTWTAGTATAVGGSGVAVAYRSTATAVWAMSALTNGSEGKLFSSADGVTWTERKTLENGDNAYALACDGTTFVAGTNQGRIYTSTDAITWTQISATGYTAIVGSCLDEYTVSDVTTKHTWLLADKGALIKDTAQLIETGISTTWRDMVRCGDHLIVVGDSGKVATSVDGILWSEQTSNSPGAADLLGVTYNSAGPLVVAVGDTGTIITSPDGYTWTDRTDGGMTKNLTGVAWNGTVYIAVGADGKIQSSTNGTSWTDRTPAGETKLFNGVYSTTTLAIAVGDDGMIYSSTNGTSWTSRTSGTSVDLNSVTKSGNRWLTAGDSGIVRSSTDGTAWIAVTSGVTSNINTIVYDGASYSYLAYGKIIVRIPPSVTDAVFYPLSDVYRSNAFAVVGGYVIMLGTSEWVANTWTYWPRRLRWTSPGTFNDFVGYASGSQDIPGSGYIVDARTLQNNVILFESQRIGVYSFTGDIELPFTYRVISEGLFPISNPVIVDEICYFISGQGLLYGTNGVTVDKAPGLFDLTEYVDIYDGHPVFLAFNRYTRSLLVYKYDSTATEHRCFSINPETGAYTSIVLNQPSANNHPRSLVEFVTAYAPIAQDPGIPHDGGDGADPPAGAPVYVEMAIMKIAQSSTAMVAVTDDGYVYRSANGTSWIRTALDGAADTRSIVYDDTSEDFVVCGQSAGVSGGDGPCVWYSTDDGLTWTQSVSAVASEDGNAVWSIGGVCVIGTDGGTSYSTVDYTSWTTGTTGITSSISEIYYDGGWVAGGDGGTIIYSADGINWTDSAHGLTAVEIFRFASFGGDIYATTNEPDAELLVSSDSGATWSLLTHPANGTSMNLNKVYSFGGTYLYIYGGDTSATSGIYYSSDASTWNLTNSTLYDPNRKLNETGSGFHGYEGLIRFGVDGKTYIFADRWTA